MLENIAIILVYISLVGMIVLFFNGAYRIDRYDRYDYYEDKGEDEDENF